VLWEKRLGQNPIACQRLPNGNTFIASYQGMLEVNRDGREVYQRTQGPGLFIFGAQKLHNGHIIYISAQGTLVEIDGQGKEVRAVQVATNGGWSSLEGLPGGNCLVAVSGANKIVELDPNGKAVWCCTSVLGPCSASRLPNGNTLVASMASQRVVEVDRGGNIVWEKPTEGRPFHVRRR
jgi:hypothetical protein